MARVLIVDDDANFAEVAAAHLRRAGFVVEIATDTFAALNKVAAQSFDMLIIDISMPEGMPSGLSFARMMRYREPDTRLIFVSGYRGLENLSDSLPGKLFTKPVDFDVLVAELRAQLAQT